MPSRLSMDKKSKFYLYIGETAIKTKGIRGLNEDLHILQM